MHCIKLINIKHREDVAPSVDVTTSHTDGRVFLPPCRLPALTLALYETENDFYSTDPPAWSDRGGGVTEGVSLMDRGTMIPFTAQTNLLVQQSAVLTLQQICPRGASGFTGR